MITLITGLPGNGKTLYALAWLKARAEKEGRQVFYSGIADLKLPWIEHAAEEWESLPPGSIIVIDEAQRVFRPRLHGTKVPGFVAALETHRHKGVDLVLITQHPMLVDANVRRLAGQHFHVVRKFGTQFATIHEWGSVKENCDKVREDSTKHEFRYPKEAFGWYKSAEVHTHKRRIPLRVWLFLALPLVIAGAIYGFVHKINAIGDKAVPGTAVAPAASSPGQHGATAQQRGPAKLTQAEYVAQFAPRIAGLAYTAPVYDDVTKPQRAPYPAACVSMGERCGCYTQQGTALEVPRPLCESIVAKGFFVGWDRREPPEARAQAIDRIEARDKPQVPGLISLGGNPRAHILSDR